MSVQQNILGLIDPRGQSGRSAVIWMKLLHQTTVRSDDFLAARALRDQAAGRQQKNDLAHLANQRAMALREPWAEAAQEIAAGDSRPSDW